MRKNNLDAIDIAILNRLQEDASITMRELAKSIGLTVGPTFTRVSNLWKKKIITGQKTVVDYTFFKYNRKVTVFLSVAEKDSPKLLTRIQADRHILYASELKKKNEVLHTKNFLLIFLLRNDQLDHSLNPLLKDLMVFELELSDDKSVIKDKPLILEKEDISL